MRSALSDPTFVASSIPQVVGVERTSETTANWTVEIKIGPVSRRSLFKGELLESTDAAVRFRATGSEATIDGTVGLVPAASGGTDVTLTLAMKGNGPLRAIVDAYLAKRVRADAEKFATSLKSRLATHSTAAGAPP